MTVSDTPAPEATSAVRTPPLSPSSSAAQWLADAADAFVVEEAAADSRATAGGAPSSSGSQFWCHECNARVATTVDAATDEMCCQQCGGNFVEEIESVRFVLCVCVYIDVHFVSALSVGLRFFAWYSASDAYTIVLLLCFFVLWQDDPPEVFQEQSTETEATAGATAPQTSAASSSTAATASSSNAAERDRHDEHDVRYQVVFRMLSPFAC